MLILVFVSMSLLLFFYAYHMVYRMSDLDDAMATLENQKLEPSISKAELALIDADEEKLKMQLDGFVLSTMKVWPFRDYSQQYVKTALDIVEFHSPNLFVHVVLPCMEVEFNNCTLAG